MTDPGFTREADARRLKAVYRLLELSNAGSLDEIDEAALTGLLESTFCQAAAIFLFDDDGVLRFRVARGLSHEPPAALEKYSPWTRGAQHARPVVVVDALNEPAFAASRDAMQQEQIRAVVSVPLTVEGGVIGRCDLYYSQPHQCGPEELEAVRALAAHISAIVARRRLETSTQRLAAIVEGSDDAIIGKTLNGIVRSWNKGAERIFGYTAEEMIGRPVFVIAAPDRVNEMPEILARIARGERVDHYETRRRRKDGRVIDVSLTVSPVRDVAGVIVGASKIARDITERKYAQEQLARANEELRRANRGLEAFAYSASHDLREPLRTIALSAQLLERGRNPGWSNDEARYLNNIFNSAQRMGILINDVLAYTQATQHESGPPPVVDSARVLAEVVESLHASIDGAGALITSSDLPPVQIHPSQLARLFQNLIGNAIKYRRKEVPRVHISAQEQDGWCIFSVEDNGIGIEPEYAQRIFELFKRLHTREEYPGSGLGLAICQRVVEQAGGRIWLEQSTPGRGSTFCFAIPSGK